MPPKQSKKSKSPNLSDRLRDCEISRYHTLDISALALDKWPDEIMTHSNIKILIASKNNFRKIPVLEPFRLIESINFSRNNIYTIDNINFGLFPDLKVIDISRNLLTSIPPEISKLPFIEVINLSYNKLVSVPSSLVEMTSLREVDLSHNELANIGDQFERLPLLEVLNLAHNPPLDPFSLPTRTRRLHEKQELLKSKAERRALIQRALGVRREVLNHTQKVILNDCDSEFGALAV